MARASSAPCTTIVRLRRHAGARNRRPVGRGSGGEVGDHRVEQREPGAGDATPSPSRSIMPSATSEAIRDSSDRPAAQLLETVGVDAFVEAQAHQQEFVALLLARHARPLDEAVAVASRPRSHISGCFRSRCARRRPWRHEAPMRARADAGIFAIAPIDEVVPALGAGRAHGSRSRRPAGHARSQISCVTSNRRAARRRRASTSLPAACSRSKTVSGLDGQLVEREMFAGVADRLVEFGPPRRGVWPGRA